VKYFYCLKVLLQSTFLPFYNVVAKLVCPGNNHFVWTVLHATWQHSHHIEFVIFVPRLLVDNAVPCASKQGSLHRRQSMLPVWFQVNTSVKITVFYCLVSYMYFWLFSWVQGHWIDYKLCQKLLRESKKMVSQNEGNASLRSCMCIHVMGKNLQATAAANSTENPDCNEMKHSWRACSKTTLVETLHTGILIHCRILMQYPETILHSTLYLRSSL